MRQSVKPAITTPDVLILNLLSDKPMHGYEIVQELNRINASDWITISQPQVYYSLEKLATHKWITPVASAAGGQGPKRQKYKTSTAGLTKLKSALIDEKWAIERVPPLFHSWIGLSASLSTAEKIKMVKMRRAFIEAQLLKEHKDLKMMQEREVADYMAEDVIGLIIRQYEVEIQWLGDLILNKRFVGPSKGQRRKSRDDVPR